MTYYTFTHLQFAVAFNFFEPIPFSTAQFPTPSTALRVLSGRSLHLGAVCADLVRNTRPRQKDGWLSCPSHRISFILLFSVVTCLPLPQTSGIKREAAIITFAF